MYRKNYANFLQLAPRTTEENVQERKCNQNTYLVMQWAIPTLAMYVTLATDLTWTFMLTRGWEREKRKGHKRENSGFHNGNSADVSDW